ncbi:hypothetical protein BLNAU_5900 [Blattamonas nauphoetae]|uniref:Bromo domain-containing protein n=1 Tax=Blattamonas nauphoetae TaxID=2049346 RepID=A0ABQ9Y5Y1_9EUKA|nr:hypothetical protein BLNAU_5900 [Blattamonas nauphoetae]
MSSNSDDSNDFLSDISPLSHLESDKSSPPSLNTTISNNISNNSNSSTSHDHTSLPLKTRASTSVQSTTLSKPQPVRIRLKVTPKSSPIAVRNSRLVVTPKKGSTLATPPQTPPTRSKKAKIVLTRNVPKQPEEPVIPPPSIKTEEEIRHIRAGERFRFFRQMVGEVLRNKNALPFAQPVDPIALNVPNYHLFITNPMDLGTIRHKLEYSKYGSAVKDVVTDLTLVIDNCYHFNQPKSVVSLAGEAIQRLMVKKMDNSKLFEPEEIATLFEPHPYKYFKEAVKPIIPPLSGEQLEIQKQRAKLELEMVLIPFEGDDVPLSDDEKEHMFDILDKLPHQHIVRVMEFLRQTGPYTYTEAANSDIELDIDDMNVRVLRHLEKFLLDTEESLPLDLT